VARSVGFVGVAGSLRDGMLFGRKGAVVYGYGDHVRALMSDVRGACGVVRSICAVGRLGRCCWLRHDGVALGGVQTRMEESFDGSMIVSVVLLQERLLVCKNDVRDVEVREVPTSFDWLDKTMSGAFRTIVTSVNRLTQ
jgi:hypothetical protein